MCTCGVAQRLHDPAVAVTAEAHEVVVLPDDLVAGPGEVERERRHVAAEVVDVEHEVLGQVLCRPPDDEADARVGQAVLVARHVDRLDLREPEVPFEVGMQERGDEPAARRVDVDRDVGAVLGVVGDDAVVDLLDRFELAGVGGAEDRDHADRVLVDVLHDVSGATVNRSWVSGT